MEGRHTVPASKSSKKSRMGQTLLSFKEQVATFLIKPEMRKRMVSKVNHVATFPDACQTTLNINETLGG
jgi:hypothetical protein